MRCALPDSVVLAETPSASTFNRKKTTENSGKSSFFETNFKVVEPLRITNEKPDGYLANKPVEPVLFDPASTSACKQPHLKATTT